ncbi:MAG: restriction endonuclease subunit S [Treponema sp.]|nr:restriction endonuclease subunit S [Treponema sp.]
MSQWKKVRIGDICKIVKGTTGIASAEPGQYPLVVTAEERKTCSSYQFDCEAVCIPLVSSSGHGKKSLKNVHYQSGKFALGTILCAVIPNNPDELDARFLHQYLQFYKDTVLVPLMKGAANVSLSMKDISTVEFPLPPIEKQRELSNLFITLQESQKKLTAETEQQLEYTKLLRQNILQDAIEGKLTAKWRKSHPVIKGNPDYDAEALFEKIQKGEVSPSLQPDKPSSATPSAGSNAARNTRSKKLSPITDEEKPFEIPEEWKWIRLGEIVSILGDGIHGTPEYDSKGDYYFINGNNLKDGHIIIKEGTKRVNASQYEKYKKELNNNTIFVSINGTLGNLAFYNGEKIIFGKSACYFNLFLEEMKLYIYYFLQTDFFIQYATDKASLTTIYNVSLAAMRNLLISLPPLKEQEEIVKKVESLLAKVTELENQIQERKTLSEKLAFGIIKERLEG